MRVPCISRHPSRSHFLEFWGVKNMFTTIERSPEQILMVFPLLLPWFHDVSCSKDILHLNRNQCYIGKSITVWRSQSLTYPSHWENPVYLRGIKTCAMAQPSLENPSTWENNHQVEVLGGLSQNGVPRCTPLSAAFWIIVGSHEDC